MSFLNRRRSFAPSLPLTAASITAPISFPPAVENICGSKPSTISSSNDRKASRQSLLIRRVSLLFSGRRKRAAKVPPLDFVQPDLGSPQRWQILNDDDSISESDSIDDIRRPSGLGRAISASSNRSLPPSPFTPHDEDSPFNLHVAVSGFERVRSLSSPDLMTGRVKFKASQRSLTMKRTNPKHTSFISKLPAELLVTVLSLLPRQTVADIARVHRDFCTAARIVLYDSLDLRTFSQEQIEQLVTLLAFRRDLTDLVHTLECHTWPSFFPPGVNTNSIGALSFSPTLTATFTVAFQNMHHLTTLVLPSFDETFLRHHSAFGLRKITFLCTTMSATETTELFTWLDGQTNITYLAFPNLAEQMDTLTIPQLNTDTTNGNTKQLTGITANGIPTLNTDPAFLSSHRVSPSCSPESPMLFIPSPTIPVSPFTSPTLLPSLTTMEAPPSIVTSLMSSGPCMFRRPLDHVILSVNTTLYTGLRPSALMASLQGITKLKLIFGPAADRRTLGKLLSAAGAALTGDGVKHLGRQGLRVLQIELSDSDSDADQALYKIINAVLSRFHGLLSLQLRFFPDRTNSLDHSMSTELDGAMVTLWTKHCPSLESITMLSGAVWHDGNWTV